MASPAFGRRRFHEKKKLTFCAFVLARVVIDIREGQRCQNRPFFFLGGEGFLTLGKVNCHRHGLGVGAKIDRFSGRGGGSDPRVAYTELFLANETKFITQSHCVSRIVNPKEVFNIPCHLSA